MENTMIPTVESLKDLKLKEWVKGFKVNQDIVAHELLANLTLGIVIIGACICLIPFVAIISALDR